MFVDFLAFQQATLLFAAVLVGYVAATGWWAFRQGGPTAFAGAMKSAAAPLGSVGAVATALALWGEVAWPLPGAYNIFFTDIYFLFGATLLVLAISMATSAKLQYAGMFAMVAGAVTLFYGWSGFQLGLTKEPFETFLLYGAFGMTGIVAFPTTLAVDYWVAHPVPSAYATDVSVPVARPSFMSASRGVQPVFPTNTTGNEAPSYVPRFQGTPIYVSVTLLVFLVFVAAAALAAAGYLDSTVPSHLKSPP